MTRVALADDHELVRKGLRSLLETSGIEVVGEASTGDEAVQLARDLAPDVILMDIAMRPMNGIDATRHIGRQSSGVRVIVLSMHSDPRYVRAAMAAGARGYLLKDAVFDELIAAIQTVVDGEQFFGRSVTETLGARADDLGSSAGEEAERLALLTTREQQILQLIAEGETSADIAGQLGISPRTVDTHRTNINRKLGTRSVAGLTQLAIRHGLCFVSPLGGDD